MIHLLGKKPPRHDRRMLSLPMYTASAPIPPSNVDWTPAVTTPWGMMENDSLGDCTCAGMGHAEMLWSANTGSIITPTDAQVLSAYEAVGGYVPGNPNTDNGAVELDVLKYWQNTGIGGRKILAYADVNPALMPHIKQAIWLFGVGYIGVSMPLSAQDQVGQIWDITGDGKTGNDAPGSWGGHCLSPSTRILTNSLEWVALENIKEGQSIVGFDENGTAESRRLYKTGIVLANKELNLPCYDVEFSDGTIIRAAEDHLWLNRDGKWIRTDKMQVDITRISRPLIPWTTDTTREAGYLAAAFDGEGWIDGESNRGLHKIGFAQKSNEMWDYVLDTLATKQFNPTIMDSRVGGFSGSGICNYLQLTQRQQLLRFLGSIRPHRLLSKFDASRLGMLYSDWVKPTKITSVGSHPVRALQTTTGTYIAEGFAAHNCVIIVAFTPDELLCVTWGQLQRMTYRWFANYCDEFHVPLSTDWINAKGVAASGFDLPTLQSDLQLVTA